MSCIIAYKNIAFYIYNKINKLLQMEIMLDNGCKVKKLYRRSIEYTIQKLVGIKLRLCVCIKKFVFNSSQTLWIFQDPVDIWISNFTEINCSNFDS